MPCLAIKAGSLRHTIIIERSSEVSDGAGGTTDNWVTHKTLRAKVKPLSGNERLFASRIESNTSHLITIRYTTDILESDRILFKGKYLNITAIINVDEADKFLELSATEGVAT